ncbi:MAG TPA: alpha/beta hydrolase [Thermoanaerobaculia bacterium]
MKHAALAVLLAAVLAAPLAAQPSPGWSTIAVPATGSYFLFYVPQGADLAQPTPVVLFFHGAGWNPASYRAVIGAAADKAGCAVAMPKSSDYGWGTEADARTVAETLSLVRQKLPVDDRRIAVAGHSAGGAYAYLLAYAGSQYSAVFTMAASYYPVSKLADPAYTPPIHMYYGTKDPNYTGGAYANLKAQWSRLGVPWEEDVQEGYGHTNWPGTSVTNGFLFLAGESRPGASSVCTPTATNLCLNRGRFRVEVAWDANGTSGSGKVVPGASANSGAFWFFAPANWDVMVRVTNGCASDQHFRVSTAGASTVHYVVKVTDTATGKVKQYENPAGQAAVAAIDSHTFACP